MLVGGSLLALMLFLIFGVALDRAARIRGQELAFVLEYIVAILIGVAAAMALRRSIGFGSGLLLGLAAGLLGGTALCNAIAGGVSNMH